MHHLTRFSLRNPGLTIAAILAITALAALGALRIETNAGFRAYVGADHPAVRQLDRFIERFGGGLPVAAVWSCDETEVCDSVFDEASLLMAYEVARSVEKTIGVRSVRSPATSPLLVPTDDGFEVRTFVEGGQPVADRAELARRAMIDPLWRRNLISPDGRVGAIVLELGSSESELNIRAVADLFEALRPFESRGFEFSLVGDPVEFVVAGDDLRSDSLRLVPVIVVVIAAVLVALFRSWRAALISLGSVGLSVVWAFGVMGWLGWPQTALSQALAPFILTVGVCNAIHVLSRYASETSNFVTVTRESSAATVVAVAGDVGGACLLASVTTAVGFASFTTSGALSFAQFGLIAAAGVLSGLILSFSLLPVLLVRARLSELSSSQPSELWSGILQPLIRGVHRRPRVVLLSTAAVACLSILGVRLLQIDVSVTSVFGEETRVVRWIRFVREELRNPDTLEIDLEIPRERSLREPEVMQRIALASSALLQISELSAARSVVESVAWANRLLHKDAPELQRPADSPEANAELLFVLSVHDPTILDRWVSLDQRHVRISLEAAPGSYRKAEGVLGWVDKTLESHFSDDGWRAEITGPVKTYYHMVDEVQRTQLRSFLTAAVVVCALVGLFFRSMSWAVAAMIPTLLPVLVTLGAMGAWGIYLDMGTAMVAAVVLGIAIDDTVHLLVQYRRRRNQGLDPEDAMREAALHVGRAVVTTSLALSLGFFVLTLSSWASVASFGFLAGLAILGAMAADLIVLPALIVSIARLQHRSIIARKLWAT